MEDKSRFVGKKKAILKFEGTTLELPIAVSKVCVTCPYWEDDGLAIGDGITVRPACGKYTCNANEIFGDTAKERKELNKTMEEVFGDLFSFGGKK